MAQSLKLEKYITITANLICKTGLRIGGTEAGMGPGSAENPVIKDAQGIPYIPGSSLKGKLRSILEYKYDKVNIVTTKGGTQGIPCSCGQKDCPVCTIFGPHNKTSHDLGPTRLIVRDAFLSDESRKDWESARNEGKEFTETKTETSIDRKTGMAARGSLRTQERVNAGTGFLLNMSMRIFEGDAKDIMKQYMKEALEMLQQDYLGGSGTRGYGWVEIKDLKIDGEPV